MASGGVLKAGLVVALTGAVLAIAAHGIALSPGPEFVDSDRANETMADGPAGGGASVLADEKPANGTFTAAFSAIFARTFASGKGGRPLTANEMAEARREYGAAIDYEAVRIYGRRWLPFQPDKVAMAPNGNIYWPAARSCADLTSCSATVDGRTVSTLRTFMHEMAHVMQYQNGVNVIVSALPIHLHRLLTGRVGTLYLSANAFDVTPSISGLDIEAQADWHRHNYCAKSGRCPQ